MPERLAIIATHPIQYYAPIFRLLTERAQVEVRVFYGWTGGANAAAFDAGFGKPIQWDIPLLSGYDHTFVSNESDVPGTEHFRGITSKSLIPAVLSWKPSAILVYGWRHASHLAAMRYFHGRVPVLFRGDSTLLDERRGVRRLLRRGTLKWVYQHVDVALYVGRHNRAYFEAHGLRDARLRWAPHSVDNERFEDLTGDHQRAANRWRQELGIPRGHTVLLFAGKLEKKKAPELLLERFLLRRRESEHLIFVGTGPLEEALRLRAAPNPNVHFLGFQNQSRMPAVYRLAEAFVLPSRGPGETWGLAVNEAMASGRPVIVSDHVGCAPDLVENDGGGAVFRSDSAPELDVALSKLLDDPAARLRLATAASQRIRNWAPAEQAQRLERAVAEFATRS